MGVIVGILLILTVAIPIAWFASEFKSPLWLRLLLGTCAILLCFGVAYIAGSLQMLNADAWFGSATKDLIDTTIKEMDAGHQDQVVRSLKDLQAGYTPTYENRSRYDELVKTAIEQMQRHPATRLAPQGPPN